jgi:LysR family transcriptional regulator, transcriptional activator for aaeXAB operon
VDISFEQLKSMVVFSHVVEQGSFSAAASILGFQEQL